VLDAGARGFEFSKWFADKGHEVYAVDPAPDIQPQPTTSIRFYRQALVGMNSEAFASLNTQGDAGAWHIQPQDRKITDESTVSCTDVMCFSKANWDVIKLNVEGSEYVILDTWPGPIARQIVVSFHEHTPRAKGRAECDRLIAKMGQWYKAFNVVWEKRYCCSENYWDVLFIRNDLV
jgi:FkbM family methyltransferase